MNKFMGLDLSLAGTGIVVIDESFNVLEAITIKTKLRGIPRLNFIACEIIELIEKHSIATVAMEGYSMGSRTGQAFSIGELGGVVKWMLRYQEAITDPVIVAPTQLKKFITGKGNAPKDQIMMNVLKRWGYEASDNNVADAYGLARIGYIMGTGIINTGELIAAQHEVITALIEKDK